MRYCTQNAELDAELCFWHEQLQHGHAAAQAEIDRRLLVCILLENGLQLPPSLHYSRLLLDRADILCTANLPDIIWVFRSRLLHGHYSTALQDLLFRYSIPCIRKNKNASASGHSADDHDLSMYSSYIRIMFGTLLALYPQCSKRPTFCMRKQVVHQLYATLCGAAEQQRAFLHQHVNIARLCIMEYFVYVLHEFCNVERDVIAQCLNIQTYSVLCQTSTDNFRHQCLQGAALDWSHMDACAFKTIDKIVRTTRISVKLTTSAGNVIGIRKLGFVWTCGTETTRLTRQLVCELPPCFWHHDNLYLYSRMVQQWLRERGEAVAPAVAKTLAHNTSVVHHMVHVFDMPLNLTVAQTRALLSKHGNDHMLIHSICTKTICLHCIMNIKQACNAFSVVNNTRMCMKTCRLMCNKCVSSEFLVNVNLIGKWLQIERFVYFLCPFCVCMHAWGATGCEFTHCGLPAQPVLTGTAPKRKRTESDRAACGHGSRNRCYVCQKVCNSTNMLVIDTQRMRTRSIFMCSKHYIPQHMQRFIKNMDNLHHYLQESGIPFAPPAAP